MRNYIVRIYREEINTKALVGIVEEVGESGKKAFTTLDELWEILKNERTNKSARKGGNKIRDQQ